MIEWITCIGSLSAAIYLLILLYFAIGIFLQNKKMAKEQPLVSVVVAAHNESLTISVG